jgi:hypothetical protein
MNDPSRQLLDGDGGDGGEAIPPRPIVVARLCPTPQLPDIERAYEQLQIPQPPADPVGRRGLPDTRRELNQLLAELCRMLIAGAGMFLAGEDLVRRLGLQDSRALRMLVAYGHVYHRLRQIVGLPGAGYCWGELSGEPDRLYAMVARQARRMGRCWLFNAALYGHRSPAVELLQLMLPLAENQSRGQGDELSALLAARGVGTEQMVEAMIGVVAASPGGTAILHRVGNRHADVLLPASKADDLARHLRAALSLLPAQIPEHPAVPEPAAPRT